MTKEFNPYKPTLWIMKWQDNLSNILKSKFIASFLFLFFPITATAFILQLVYNFKILNYGVTMALSWLFIAPLILQNGFYFLHSFFKDHKDLFNNKKEWESIYHGIIRKVQSPKYLIFGIPWTIATTFAVFATFFAKAPLVIQLWAIVSFSILFLISSMGFYVMYLLIMLMKDIFNADLKFDLLHPDQFGGISDFGMFSVRVALYFSTGALVFPLAFSIVSKWGASSHLSVIVYVLFALYILTLIISFIMSIFEIKKFADKKKEEILIRSWKKLNGLIADFEKSTKNYEKKAMQVDIYYNMIHKKLSDSKTYPLDIKVLLEFSLSFILPIAVVLLQIYLS